MSRLRFALLIHLANLVSRVTPPTAAFALRRALFRAAGVDVAPDSRLCGGVAMDNRFVTVGAGTFVGTATRLVGAERARVSIGRNCDVSTDVLMVTGSHEMGNRTRRAGTGTNRPITVGDGCWIGARVVVLGGVTIGDGAMVAAGAVVIDDVPTDALVGGVPARVIRSLDQV